MGTSARTDEQLREVILQRSIIDEHGCRIWQGAIGPDGYGRVTRKGKIVLVHRLAYELFVGPIPEGLQLDHVRARGCRSRSCCNWEKHLEPVTGQVNTARIAPWINSQAQRAACPQGHSYDDANTRIDTRGHRHCRTCDISARERRSAQRAARRVVVHGFDPGPRNRRPALVVSRA